jgi:hypothetical protein
LSKCNTSNSNRRSKSNNRILSKVDNHSFHLAEKTQTITNNLYQNIKEYYNINEIRINPTASTMDFYPNKITNKNIINKKLKHHIIINNNNNDSNKIKKKSIISNKKQNSKEFLFLYEK